MLSVCLPSDALSQHLPSYLGFCYLGHGVSLHGCSSKAQPLFLTLKEEYLLTTTPPDLERGVAPLGPPAPAQPLLLGCGVAPPGCCPWPWTWISSSGPRLCSVTVTCACAISRLMCHKPRYLNSGHLSIDLWSYPDKHNGIYDFVLLQI